MSTVQTPTRSRLTRRFAYLTANSYGNIRKEDLHGRPHYVVPVSMIVPGVLNGSRGALLYTVEEIARNYTAWNGMPLVVYHPFKDGKAISARDPQVLNAQCIGTVLNSRVTKRGILAAEAWIDIERCRRIDNRILIAVERKEKIELSTGLFTKNDPAPAGATFNGIPYDKIARRYVPDHLAILPDQTGACSVNDGCGLGVVANQNNDGNPDADNDEPTYHFATTENWSDEARKAAMLARHHGGKAIKAAGRAVGSQIKSSAKNLLERLKAKIGLGKKKPDQSKPSGKSASKASSSGKSGKGTKRAHSTSKQRSADRLKKLQDKLKKHRDAKTAKAAKMKAKQTVRSAKKNQAASKASKKRSDAREVLARLKAKNADSKKKVAAGKEANAKSKEKLRIAKKINKVNAATRAKERKWKLA